MNTHLIVKSKSFVNNFIERYSLIHVLTYGMLIIPSLGYVICENRLSSLVVVSEVDVALQNTTANIEEDLEMLVPVSNYSFCKPDNMFFPRPLWQYMLLLFAIFRVAYPFILIKSDSYLRQKINFIVRLVFLTILIGGVNFRSELH